MSIVERYKKIPLTAKIAIDSVVALLLFGTIFYHFTEGWTWIQSLYFTVMTLTTVGYGDLHPTTDLTRLVTVFFVLSGVSTIAAFLSLLGARKFERRVERIETESESLK